MSILDSSYLIIVDGISPDGLDHLSGINTLIFLCFLFLGVLQDLK